MKKIKHFLLTTLVLLGSALTSWAAPYSGTPSASLTKISESNYTNYGFTAENWQAFQNYYAIASAEDLYGFAALVNGGTAGAKAVLTADIVVNLNVPADGNLNGATMHSWTPIGTSSNNFNGTFDGNGHTISGLYFENTTDGNYPDGGNRVGLIGFAHEATIKNVGVIGSYIRGYSNVGCICGYSSSTNTNITNCYNTGTVSGSYRFVGGICGYYSTITNCYNTGTVSGSGNSVGGICGYSGTQTNCYYLEGCGSKNTLGTSATADEFGCGKITYLLNGSTSGNDNAWRQTFGVGGDAYPVLDNTHSVVYATQPCTSGFSNAEGAVTPHSSVNEIGYCPVCGRYTTAATLTDGVYQIGNAAQLYWFADFVNNGETTANAVLTADITVNATIFDESGTLNGTPIYSWTPIGTNANRFKGTFDGKSHTISGLYFENTTNDYYPYGGYCVGLIGSANGAAIKNVGVVDSYLKGSSYVGGICGYGYNSTKITNCHNTGTVSGSSYVGGICGIYGTLTNCHNTGTVSGSGNYVGGICGEQGVQTNCYNTGTVSGVYYGSNVGGICGRSGTQTNCYNTGTVTGSAYVGGICGRYGTITCCYNTGTVSSSGSGWVGGICGNGDSYTYITNCHNTGTVSGSSVVGGICGTGGTLTNCYYLEGCAKDGNNAVQYGVGNATQGQTTADVAGKTISATTEDFESGKVTYLLNGSTSGDDNTWRQTLGSGGDAHPVLDNHSVVYAKQPCTSEFSNTEGGHNEHPSSMDAIGRCTACGKFIAQGTLVTESNCSGLNLTTDFVDYYVIRNSAELYWFADFVNNGETDAKAVLTENIVVNEKVLNDDGTLNGTPTYSWTPIGTSSQKYAGTFDGNGHTISGLYFNDNTNLNYPTGGNTVGLIGSAYGATIKNVGVIDSYLKGYSYVGGICGYGSSNTNITNCYNTGTVSSYNNNVGHVGGICGFAGTQTNCYNTGTVSSGSYYVGGICGFAGTQTNCYNTGTVSGSAYYVGGICGSGGTQTNCYNTGMVSGQTRVGGICGTGGTLTNCYNTGTVSGSYYYVGGICGSGGTQTNCYYLEGCAKDGNNVEQFGVGNSTQGQTTADTEGNTIAATAAEFASGKIGYLLNNGENTAWYQNLYADELPSLDDSRNLASGYIAGNENDLTVIGDMFLATDYTVAEEKTLTIPEGASLTTTGEAVITNSGTLCANGTLAGNNLAGEGTFVTNRLSLCNISNLSESYVYKGTAYTLEDGLSGVAVNTTILGKTFTLDATNSPSYTNNRNVGTATITWTNTADENDILSGQFEITPKDVELVWGEAEFTYNGVAQAPTATATGMVNGEELTVTVSGEQTAAGTYTATACISDNNYKLPEVVTKEFTIGKATPTYTAPENLSIKCNESLANITLPAGFAFENLNVELTEGDNTLTVKFTPEDTDNYKVVEGIEVKVVKAAHTAVPDAAVPATCTESGLTEGSHCSVCNEVLVAQEVIPAGHKADSVVFENVVAATRTAAGSYDSVVYCSVCRVELSRTTVNVPQILAESIKLASKPNKVEYKQGEALDVKGGKITIGYTDKSTEDFEILAGWVSGFDSEKTGKQTLTVTFESVSSTLTTTFNVTVSAKDDDNTAIDEDAANKVNIYAYQNVIVVENATDEIDIYNAMGALVCRDAARHVSTATGLGARTEIRMNTTGVYIVKVGNVAKRVMVND